MGLHSFTIFDIFKRNAKLYKGGTAIVFEDKRVTFGDLYDQVLSLAYWLFQKGIKKGDRVAILSKNHQHFFTSMGAISALGAIMVPINFRLSADEIEYNLIDTEPVAIFVDKDFEEIAYNLRSKCLSLREFVTFEDNKGNFKFIGSLLNDKGFKAFEIEDDDPFVIMHTAAVQGRPRGAIISHRNLISGSIQLATTIGLTKSDIYLNIIPLFHIAGLVMAISVMHVGGENVILSKFDPKLAGKMIDQLGVTIIGDFPPILAQLLDEQSKGGCKLSSLRHVAGIELQDTIKRFESLGYGKFWLAYGQTETMGWTCLSENSERPGGAGRPGPLVDLKIVDEFDREVGPGVPGEILVRGPLVFQGYWRDEELTRYTFRDQWHHTGDIGRIDEDGYLWFVGRKAEKELIKTGGENVYPVEVEKVILEHPGVKEVSVIGVTDPKFGEGIKAVCVLKAGTELTAQELIDFVGSKIARYKKPGYIQFVDSLPKKDDGSIDRQRVKELYGK